MKRLFLSVCLLVAVGCGSDPQPQPESSPESGSNVDYCEEFGWYDDGHCDDVCPKPDPDCDEGTNNVVVPPGNNGPPPPPANNTTEPDPPPPPVECPDVPGEREYVAYGDECALVDYACVDGWVGFEDDCGCGCEAQDSIDPVCEDLEFQGEVQFVSEDPDECSRIFFTCADDQIPFDNECGCGCITPWDTGLACLDDTQPWVERLGDERECLLIDFGCSEGWTYFDDDCGCGCRKVCSDDFECPDGFCNLSVDDLPFCQAANCDDGTMLACRQAEPDCYDGEVAAIINGCWECRDARTCGPSMGP